MREPLAAPELTVVTGAGGWLGQNLVRRLAGTPVRAVVQHDDDVSAALKQLDGVEVVVGDVTAPADLDRLLTALPGTTDVVHTAGVIHPARIADFFEVNANGTQNVLGAARRAGVRRVVHVSSNSPFGTNPHRSDRFRADEPFHPYLAYGRSKMMAELAVRAAVE